MFEDNDGTPYIHCISCHELCVAEYTKEGMCQECWDDEDEASQDIEPDETGTELEEQDWHNEQLDQIERYNPND